MKTTLTATQHTPASITQTIADGLDASTDGRGFTAEHMKAMKLANAAPDLLAAYGTLHDMLSDMIEGGRLKREDIPDDYEALVAQLSGPCNAAIQRATT